MVKFVSRCPPPPAAPRGVRCTTRMFCLSHAFCSCWSDAAMPPRQRPFGFGFPERPGSVLAHPASSRRRGRREAQFVGAVSAILWRVVERETAGRGRREWRAAGGVYQKQLNEGGDRPRTTNSRGPLPAGRDAGGEVREQYLVASVAMPCRRNGQGGRAFSSRRDHAGSPFSSARVSVGTRTRDKGKGKGDRKVLS